VSIVGEKELIAEFEDARVFTRTEAKKVVSKGAVNIKTDWRAAWKGIKHAPRLPLSISYDITESDSEIVAEIGPVEGPQLQGFLGPIIEFGGIHNAPIPGGLPALQAEEPRFAEQCDVLLGKAFP
jgi:hypothetical protein